jgi:hypothetical protein
LDLLLGIIIIQVLTADFLHLRSYQDGTGGSDNLVTFLKSGIGMRFWQQAYGSATAYATFKDVAFTDDRFTDARTPLSHSLLFSHSITIAQLSTLVSDATLISSTDSGLEMQELLYIITYINWCNINFICY